MNKWKHAGIHLMLWIGYLLLYASLWRTGDLTFSQGLIREVSFLPVKIILVYITIYYLVPKYLQNKRYIEFVLVLIALIVISGLLHNFYLHSILSSKISGIPSTELFFDVERISKRITYLNSPMLFALTLVVIRNWYEQKERNAKIMQENLSARLQLLKDQIQPHFFFNTLNNLYSMALQKSDQTPAMILKLADLMRYLMDKHERDWISVMDEVEFIRNYVVLEEIRYQDKVTIHWNISLDSKEDSLIPPLILTAFVENAFKHGVSGTTHAAIISIDLKINSRLLVYIVKNTKPLSTGNNSVDISTGTGLANLKSRLEILYGNDFNLNIKENETSFTATLKMPLLP